MTVQIFPVWMLMRATVHTNLDFHYVTFSIISFIAPKLQQRLSTFTCSIINTYIYIYYNELLVSRAHGWLHTYFFYYFPLVPFNSNPRYCRSEKTFLHFTSDNSNVYLYFWNYIISHYYFPTIFSRFLRIVQKIYLLLKIR